jgi:hypothetical protein
MSLDLPLVNHIMYLCEGEVNPGDEDKVIRYKEKLGDWQCDVVNGQLTKKPTREEMSSGLFQLEHSFNRYWCEGEKCGCTRTHWLIHASKLNCWECMHDPCACSLPLVWDDSEQAYYHSFLSCNGKTKKNLWIGNMATINFNQGRKRGKGKGREVEIRRRICQKPAECAKLGLLLSPTCKGGKGGTGRKKQANEKGKGKG